MSEQEALAPTWVPDLASRSERLPCSLKLCLVGVET